MHGIYSNGSGRTGTFVTIYTTLERIKTDGTVDIFQVVKSSRLQRAHFVANAVSNKSLHVNLDSVASYRLKHI